MKASEFLEKLTDKEQIQQKLAPYQAELRKTQLARQFETCGICGGDLALEYATNYLQYTVRESGACSCCGTKVPVRAYRLN